MVSQLRAQKIADRIREELSEMVIQAVQDPRLLGLSITDVTVDRELAYADVYVSALEGSQRAPEVITGLQHAGGYLRSELVKRIDLRVFPRLRFHWDATFERAERIEHLLDSLNIQEASDPEKKDDEVDE